MSKLSIISLICAVLAFALVQADDEMEWDWKVCKIEFPDKDKRIKMVKDCAEKAKYNLKLKPTMDEIKEELKALQGKDFDDGCFSKCLLESSNLLDAGKVAVAKVDDFYKGSNINPELLALIKTTVEGCVKDIEPKFKDEKEPPCKMYTMIQVCIFTKAFENKAKVEEICKKA